MCMKKFDAEKVFFNKLKGFFLSHFSMTAPSNWWLKVYTLWNQLILELSLDLFNTLKISCRHIEDVHEEVWCRKNIFLTNLQGFYLSHFFNTLKICCKRCAWRNLMLKKYFLTNSMQGVSSKSYLLPSFICASVNFNPNFYQAFTPAV